jgi:hypothetical protein
MFAKRNLRITRLNEAIEEAASGSSSGGVKKVSNAELFMKTGTKVHKGTRRNNAH